MKKVSQTLWIRIAAIAVVIILGVSVGFGQKKTTKKRPTLKPKTTTATTKTPAPKTYELAAGAKFRARMNEEISSKTSKVGDTFTVTVVDPMYAEGGELVIPSGSIITGKITQVTPAKRGGKEGMIDVEFVSVKLPSKKSYTINGSLTDLDEDKTKSDDEGQVSGKGIKYRKIVFIGGGAAGGALLGAIVGGGKATAIGAVVGAGAGVAADLLLKGPEAVVKPGTEFGIYLNKAIWLPKYVPTSEETTTPTSN
jgi:hypothetical protein